MWEKLSRRGILAGGLAVATRMAFPARPAKAHEPRRVLRIAHFTDVHLSTSGDVPQRFARCLDKIAKVDQPDIVFDGGDIVWDATKADRSLALAEYDLAGSLIAKHLSAPTYHCVGNHDPWGWTRFDTTAIQSDPLYGKAMWLNWAGYTSPYYSFNEANWHFIVLDSIQPSHRGVGYIARLDDDQWRWLQNDVASVAAETPICIVSHAPFIHAGVQFLEAPLRDRRFFTIPGSLLHTDAAKFKDLLAAHRNVKLCLSGHIHMFSRVHYNGAAHIGGGAVSGAWWKGDMQETPPGYTVVDLYEDGRVKSRFETY